MKKTFSLLAGVLVAVASVTSAKAVVWKQTLTGTIDYLDNFDGYFDAFGVTELDSFSAYFTYDDTALTGTGLEYAPYLTFGMTLGSVSFEDTVNLDSLNELDFYDGVFDGTFIEYPFEVGGVNYTFFGGVGAAISIYADETLTYDWLSGTLNLPGSAAPVALTGSETTGTSVPDAGGTVTLMAMGLGLLAFGSRGLRGAKAQ
ncbi:MAG: hypothetical protein RI897_903 [Verrucomicrobiota bacterium]|jgi:hypothetical protein